MTDPHGIWAVTTDEGRVAGLSQAVDLDREKEKAHGVRLWWVRLLAASQ